LGCIVEAESKQGPPALRRQGAALERRKNSTGLRPGGSLKTRLSWECVVNHTS